MNGVLLAIITNTDDTSLKIVITDISKSNNKTTGKHKNSIQIWWHFIVSGMSLRNQVHRVDAGFSLGAGTS